ncbi:JmjC domain protein [Macrophomina phaseolina]|uniref:JmjC domain protein n=1 Tax=Macrophomina phaseolina TaxID=35725 RepID=A0ABQ8FXK5_9PEZI|nr:JmjC domain protein [Macrophomina phaseolina]
MTLRFHDSGLWTLRASPSFSSFISHHHLRPRHLQMPQILRPCAVAALSRASPHRASTKWMNVKPIGGVPSNVGIPDSVMNEPRVLSESSFENIDAIYHWFKVASPQSDVHMLRTEVFRPYANLIVPLEYTGPDPVDTSRTIFKRFNAPLEVFLDYLEQPTEKMRLYLAQCSINDLPKAIRRLFPAPPFVHHHGSVSKKPGLWRTKREPQADIYDTALWIGLPPTYTPLHRDPNPNCFFQMAGEKTVRLFPPDKGLEIFQRVKQRIGVAEGDSSGRIRGEEMMMGREKEELEKEVWDSGYDPESGGLQTRLQRGQGLYIPQGWWHSVRGHGEGITASVNWWFRWRNICHT